MTCQSATCHAESTWWRRIPTLVHSSAWLGRHQAVAQARLLSCCLVVCCPCRFCHPDTDGGGCHGGTGGAAGAAYQDSVARVPIQVLRGGGRPAQHPKEIGTPCGVLAGAGVPVTQLLTVETGAALHLTEPALQCLVLPLVTSGYIFNVSNFGEGLPLGPGTHYGRAGATA